MTDLSVSERRIRPIQEAAAAKNWKQALQLCDKWQKKGEKSDRFLALKASILINQPDKGQADKGRAETLQLCRRPAPVTDIEALYQLQENLKRLALQNVEGPKLWDRVVSAVPKDKNLLMTWLNGALVEGNWLMSQKAAMALRKAFPKERKYDFWNILLCLLAQQDDSLTEKERNLFGTLAYRLISKTAEANPTDQTQLLSPGKSIATVEELALLTAIYDATGQSDEAIRLLQNQTIGLGSRVAEQDPSMVFSLLLKSLSVSKSFDLIFNTLQFLLSETNPAANDHIDDDRIWKSVTNHGKSEIPDQYQRCLSLAVSVLRRKPMCRAAHLAKLSLLSSSEDEAKSQSSLLTAIEEYYHHFRTKPFCFGDLLPALGVLDTQTVKEFLSRVSSGRSTITERLLKIKIEYNLLQRSTSTDHDYLAFATSTIRFHNTLEQEKNEGSESILLASLALLRLASKTQQVGIAIQASFLLANAYTQFPEYYPLAVRLVQLHRSLGQLSLATEQFVKLNVKNMQWETVGHLLLTRISTLHPLPSGFGEDSLNPLNALDSGLDMLDHMEGSLDKAIQTGLDLGNYSNVLDSVKLKQDVQASLNRQVFLVEERRIQRMAGVPVEAIRESPPPRLVDKRDFSFLEKYGVYDGTLEAFLECGPSPGSTWLRAMDLLDLLTLHLGFELSLQAGPASEALQALAHALESFIPSHETYSAQLTEAESSSLNCHHLLAKTLVTLKEPSSKQSDMDIMLDDIIAWLASLTLPEPALVNEVAVPTWYYVHCSYTYLETLQAIYLFIGMLFKRMKAGRDKSIAGSKEKLSKLQEAAGSAEGRVRSMTRKLKDGINSSGVLGRLVDTASGRSRDSALTALPEYQQLAEESAALYDDIAMEEYCGKIRESWDDMLGGILAIKMKIPK